MYFYLYVGMHACTHICKMYILAHMHTLTNRQTVCTWVHTLTDRQTDRYVQTDLSLLLLIDGHGVLVGQSVELQGLGMEQHLAVYELPQDGLHQCMWTDGSTRVQ